MQIYVVKRHTLYKYTLYTAKIVNTSFLTTNKRILQNTQEFKKVILYIKTDFKCRFMIHKYKLDSDLVW